MSNGAGSLTRQQVCGRIEELGIIALTRVAKAEDAIFAAESAIGGGISIVEIPLSVPDAVSVIAALVRTSADSIVGAGGVTDIDSVQRCVAAGARFLSSEGFDSDTMEFAMKQGIVVIPGALSPTDVVAAWKLGPDFVKIVPCGHIGGDTYLRSLKTMFPQVPMIAAGGVNQRTAFDFIRAGAIALGISSALIPREAVRLRQADQIAELAHRFQQIVGNAREQFGVKR